MSHTTETGQDQRSCVIAETSEWGKWLSKICCWEAPHTWSWWWRTPQTWRQWSRESPLLTVHTAPLQWTQTQRRDRLSSPAHSPSHTMRSSCIRWPLPSSYLSVYLYLMLSMYLSINLSVYLSVCIYLSVYLSVSVYLSTYRLSKFKIASLAWL